MATKYEPLELHLHGIPAATTELTLTFRRVEELIGRSLPRSAFEYREWWSNQKDTANRPQARAWTNAGFIVEAVRQTASSGWVRFRRGAA